MKLLVTVAPANAPVLELEVDDETWEDKVELAEYAREKWRDQVSAEVELSVSIEKADWAETGRFGTGPEEDVNLDRVMSDVYREAGLS